ncbi:hypothetical protein FGF66_12205 [Chlorobaculum thiosulfatiphilum]|jgi:hypothetical protein|uniref:DUF2304 domain-containing protein n=1 Tax=Chlorobaculum thiosulfatiphilum TaxID=115852 RepID=A0A5C4RYK0_CHLTI|nr:hypothetical protein [Chlorobaculum thiosulfatiphilum]NTU50641.1 hypothetical protein [Desulfobulbaceae bacterium]TNJ36154.1 hypothetical protein FGF66_12205 [Chlorobaculum thiosulfatiphilum]
MNKHFDIPTIIVIVTTFVLFTIALFVKGLTHDILLEAGVFLVSVKLILMSYKSSLTNQKMMDELREIKHMLNKDR